QYRGHGVTECVLVTTAHWARLTVVARETCVVGRGSEGTIMAEVRPESVDSDDDFVYVTGDFVGNEAGRFSELTCNEDSGNIGLAMRCYSPSLSSEATIHTSSEPASPSCSPTIMPILPSPSYFKCATEDVIRFDDSHFEVGHLDPEVWPPLPCLTSAVSSVSHSVTLDSLKMGEHPPPPHHHPSSEAGDHLNTHCFTSLHHGSSHYLATDGNNWRKYESELEFESEDELLNSCINRRGWSKRQGLRKKGSKYRHNHRL
ncbi:hypothetical protein OTU49_004882, partial [Cherax quadricarinatus]